MQSEPRVQLPFLRTHRRQAAGLLARRPCVCMCARRAFCAARCVCAKLVSNSNPFAAHKKTQSRHWKKSLGATLNATVALFQNCMMMVRERKGESSDCKVKLWCFAAAVHFVINVHLFCAAAESYIKNCIQILFGIVSTELFVVC